MISIQVFHDNLWPFCLVYIESIFLSDHKMGMVSFFLLRLSTAPAFLYEKHGYILPASTLQHALQGHMWNCIYLSYHLLFK